MRTTGLLTWETVNAKKSAGFLVALTLAAVGVAIAPIAAGASDSATYTVTNSYMGYYTSDGALRSEMRNITVTFVKDLIDGSHWVDLQFQIRDHSTDGWCARAEYFLATGTQLYGATECNAVWKTYTSHLNDNWQWDPRRGFELGRGTESMVLANHNYWVAVAPSGLVIERQP